MSRLYWVALQSIWTKEVNRFARIWVQTLVPPVITMTLYFIIFGNLIGSRIGEMHGFTYMQFIVPGLIMMSVITNAYANVASSFFSAKFQRNIEELLVAPVPTHIIIAGYIGGGMARGICVGILVTAVSLFFVPLHVPVVTAATNCCRAPDTRTSLLLTSARRGRALARTARAAVRRRAVIQRTQ